MSKEKDEDFKAMMAQAGVALAFAARARTAMVNAGKDMGEFDCPKCKRGVVRVVLLGKKAHMHFKCNRCDLWMME